MSKLPKGVISVAKNPIGDIIVNPINDLIIEKGRNWWYDGESVELCPEHWKAVTGISVRKGSKAIHVHITAEIVE